MNVCEQFRATGDVRIRDKDASNKPLSSNDKPQDKQRILEIAGQIAELQDILYAERRRKFLIILQGMDTSGKDGTVKGVFSQVDPLGIHSVAFRAPTLNERERDYLWRVHQRVPAVGEIVIFNRSHYEDVLVPGVHGWIDEAECTRRYAHIRDFERMLAETGTVLIKLFLHISKEEQKKRLMARIADPNKHWKFDVQDIEERKYWDQYQQAYERVIRETSTDYAPWYVIPADSKTHRNLAAASIVLQTMQDMNLAYPPANPKLAELVFD